MELPGNRLVFYEPVNSLQEISAFRVTWDLWMYKAQHDDMRLDHWVSTKYGQFASERTGQMPDAEMTKTIKALQLPNRITDIIESFASIIINEIISWLKYHRQRAIFFKYSKNNDGIFSGKEITTTGRQNLLVWRPNGRIDYEKTAKELIKNCELDVYQKFDLMCEYFMVEELRNIRDTWFESQNEKNSIFIGSALISHPTVVFWNSIISPEFPDYSTTSCYEYVKERALKEIGDFPRNFASIKFALDRLPRDDVFMLIISLIVDPNLVTSEDLIRLFFSNLTYWEQRLVFSISLTDFHSIRKREIDAAKIWISEYTSSEPFKLPPSANFFLWLVERFSHDCNESHNCCIKLWLYVQSTVNGAQFIAMLKEAGGHWESVSWKKRDVILVKLWRCSRPALKKFAYELPDDDDFWYKFCITPDFLDDSYDFVLRPDGILIEILTDAEPKFRKKLWRRFWADIVARSSSNGLKKIIRLLCLSENERKEFENSIMSSDVFRKYFTNLIRCGYCSELNAILEMSGCREKRRIVEYKKSLLPGICDPSSSVFSPYPIITVDWNELNNFLAEVFDDDVDGLVKFKFDMILSWFTSLKKFRWWHLSVFFKASEVLCDEQTLAKLKFEIVCNYLKEITFDSPRTDENLQKIVEWCS